ncbi:hypothetical protein ACFE04_016389 [Oxalis oulophora]
MVRVMRSCIQSLLKLVNSLIGMAGIAMIMYGIWLIRAWQRKMGELPSFDDDDVPWFIYTFLGLGAILSVITCLGHVAAESARGCCLYVYMCFIFMLLMLEGGVTADVFLNRDWEKDFPEDPSGSFSQFKDFIRTNFEICKWVALTVVSVQVVSLLLAMVLNALGPHQNYDSDDEYIDPERAPLLKNGGYHPQYVVIDPVYGPKK